MGTTSAIHEQQQSQIHETSSNKDGALLMIEGEEGATVTTGATDTSGLFAGLTITSSSPSSSPKVRAQSSSKTSRGRPAGKQQVEGQGHDLIDVMIFRICAIILSPLAIDYNITVCGYRTFFNWF